MTLIEKLRAFYETNKFNKTGKLSVALVMTRTAKALGLPLNPSDLLSDGKGQVQGLGGAAVKAILADHGITKTLSSEGGRTSRGSIGHMEAYVSFLNDCETEDFVDLDVVEGFWIARVRDFFAGQPFKASSDITKGVTSAFEDLFRQAEKRREAGDGMQVVGALMQHLVGAKLDCALGQSRIKHYSFSTSDSQTGRKGDFEAGGELAIHVTTTPSRNVLSRCEQNLKSNYRPILITLAGKVDTAIVYAEELAIIDRVEIFAVEQFLAHNTYEIGLRAGGGQLAGLTAIIKRYNEIIEVYETDPSLKIELN